MIVSEKKNFVRNEINIFFSLFFSLDLHERGSIPFQHMTNNNKQWTSNWFYIFQILSQNAINILNCHHFCVKPVYWGLFNFVLVNTVCPYG